MNKRKGLTLVELMIVVLILGALAAIAVPRLVENVTTAKEKACLTNIDTINSQLELYHGNSPQGNYPASLDIVTGDTQYFPDGPPECPSGGTYNYNSTTGRVTCSIHSAPPAAP